MKKINLALLIGLISFVFISCEYKDVADTEYVAQKIYLPVASYTVYDVKDFTKVFATPTQGKQKRYYLTSEKMIIPLSVYRSGFTKDGNISVNLVLNNDTIQDMINQGLLNNVEVLPAAQAAIPSSINILSGNDIGSFDLQVNRNFLLNNPGKNYVTAVTISSNDREVTPNLKTATIIIDSNLAKE